MPCNKKKFDKVMADFIIAKNAGRVHTHNRLECRKYFCKSCNAWHLTSESRREYDEHKRAGLQSRTGTGNNTNTPAGGQCDEQSSSKRMASAS
jgi:hypothetical protein